LELRNVFEVSLRTRSSRAFLLQTEGSLIFYNDVLYQAISERRNDACTV